MPLKPDLLGMKNFVLASATGIVLDVEVCQAANAPTARVRPTEELASGAMVTNVV